MGDFTLFNHNPSNGGRTSPKHFMLPKRRFWKRNNRSGVTFRGNLRAFVAQIQYSHPRKVPRKDTPDLMFRFPKSSFEQSSATSPLFWTINHQSRLTLLTNLCSPNEDFGRMNKKMTFGFSIDFQWFVAQIEYSHP